MIKGVAFAFQFLTGCHVVVREPMSKIQSFAGINTNDYLELKDYARTPNSIERVSTFTVILIARCFLQIVPDLFRRDLLSLAAGAGATPPRL